MKKELIVPTSTQLIECTIFAMLYRITGVPKIKETDLPEYNDTVILGLNHEGILSYTKRKDSGIQG